MSKPQRQLRHPRPLVEKIVPYPILIAETFASINVASELGQLDRRLPRPAVTDRFDGQPTGVELVATHMQVGQCLDRCRSFSPVDKPLVRHCQAGNPLDHGFSRRAGLWHWLEDFPSEVLGLVGRNPRTETTRGLHRHNTAQTVAALQFEDLFEIEAPSNHGAVGAPSEPTVPVADDTKANAYTLKPRRGLDSSR